MRLLFLILLCCFGGCHAGQSLIVMRHGEAMNNVARIYNTNPNNPGYRPAVLTEIGKEQVQQTAAELLAQGFNDSNIIVLFSSPLPRCVQTAEILVQLGVVSDSKLIIDQRLIERDARGLEGKPTTLVGGLWKRESKKAIQQRVNSFYDTLMQDYPEGDILVVTHSAVATALIERAAGRFVKLGYAEAVVVPLIR